MAAIYSGIHLKLKSAKTCWEDKLKLAHFAWVSHQCFLPNKEQVLLDWVSHTLVSFYNKKLDLEDEVVEKLWAYLDNIIHSRKLQNHLKNGKTISLSFSIAQVINERISEACAQRHFMNIGMVLSCCRGILSTPPLTIIYTAKYELMVDLLSKLSWLACKQLTSEDAVTSQLFDVLQLAFAQYLLLQRQQINPNRVFGQVTSHLFQACLLLRHLLISRTWMQSDDNHVRQHLGKEIRNHIETTLQTGIFQLELLSSYKEELLQEREPQRRKKGALKTLLVPVSTVQNKLSDTSFCESAVHGNMVANSVPLLYKLFLDSYCKAENQLLCFHMFTRLYGCLRLSYLQEDQQEGKTFSPSVWSTELLAIEQLLNLVLNNDIYNIAADRIRHKEIQFHFYRRLAETLVNHSQASIPAWFRCLKTLILLNHLIVEPDLDDLVASAWVDADVSELRTKKPQEALINVMFQTYTKLRQFPKLFGEVLSVICRPAVEELRLPVLSADLTVKLCECLLELPPNQILDILSLILEKCQTSIIPYVEGDSDMALKLLSLSSVLHAFMFNMKCLDNVSPLPVVLRTQSLLGELQKEVIQPLLGLLKDCCVKEENLDLWLEKTSDSALLLVYTWVEVDTLLHINCSKYVCPLADIVPAVSDSAVESWDFSALLPTVDAQCWKRVVGLSSNCFSTSKYCLELLALQKMKKILIQSSSNTEANLQALQNMAAFILESGRSSMSKGIEPWNGSASAVTAFSYPTAHWHLVVSNLTILVPYFSLRDVEYLADMLLRTLSSTQYQKVSADHESSVTVGKVSSDLLHSPLFPEIRVLHCAFISCIIQQCTGMLHLAAKSHADHPLLLLSTDNIPWHEEVRSSCKTLDLLVVPSENKLLKNEPSLCWKKMEEVAQNILTLTRTSSTVTLDEDMIERLSALLEILSALKLDSLFPSDHTRCFLLLLSLVANTRANASCSKLKFLSTCLHLLTCLQTGRNAHSSFKVFHASDVLEVVMTSLFSTSKCFDGTSPLWAEFLQVIQSFLEHFLQITVERRWSLRLNLEKFITFLANCKPSAEAARGKSRKNWNPATGQLLLVALTTLCHILTLFHQQQQERQQPREELSALLELAILQTGAAIESCLWNCAKDQPLPLTFIPSITTLLKADLRFMNRDSEAKSPKDLGKHWEYSHAKLYQKFYSQILRELALAEGHLQFLRSALKFLSVFCSAQDLYPGKETAVTVFYFIKKLLAGSGITVQVIQNIEMQLTELGTQLLETCTTEEFYVMMKLVLQGLEVSNLWKQNPQEVLSAVILIKVLLSCPLSGEKEKAFWFASPQIITALAMQCREACQDQVLIPTIVVPILEAVAALLRQGEEILTNPHHVSLTFSILLTVPLDHLKTEDYGSVFLGIHEVLFSILQCHPKVMLKAAPSFLNSFIRLVVSVMHEGRQKGERGNTDEFGVVLKCARLVERMYDYIAAKTEEFTVFSPFVVAKYVTELQKVTLHPEVKKHLTDGLYHILDLCIESDIKFLSASLQPGVREVFKELYNDYTHYHKTEKQGEEKYTA